METYAIQCLQKNQNMPLLGKMKVRIILHETWRVKWLISCLFDSTSPTHSEQPNCDEDTGKRIFLVLYSSQCAHFGL